MKRLLSFGPALVISTLIGILWLIQIPQTVSMPRLLYGDKYVHALAFAILAVALYQDAKRAQLKVWVCYLIAALWAIIWGGGLELIQKHYTTYRTGSWWDWVADLIGIAVALSIIRVWQRNK